MCQPACGSNASPQMSIQVGGREDEQVQLFRYLGGYAQEGMAHGWDVHARIGQCRATFESMQKKVWSRVEISIKTKLRIYNCLIISCLLYGAEVWELTAYQLQILEAFHVGCLRRILRVPYVQHRINAFVRMACKSPCLFALIRHRRLAWLGRLARMNEDRLPLRLVHAACPGVTHSHARRRWDKHIQFDLHSASQVCPGGGGGSPSSGPGGLCGQQTNIEP